MLIASTPRINGIPLKRGASATAAASPVRAVPVTKLMSLASLLLRIKTGLWREHTGRQIQTQSGSAPMRSTAPKTGLSPVPCLEPPMGRDNIPAGGLTATCMGRKYPPLWVGTGRCGAATRPRNGVMARIILSTNNHSRQSAIRDDDDITSIY